MSKSVVRSVKNVTKGYSSVQIKVRNATSNDAWGPTGTDMSEIAQMTFNSTSDFYEIMDMLDKRLNDKGKNWRHVLKSLKVLDYCLHEGSELVVTWARKNIYIIKTLREFQYIDEESRDVGLNVRQSAKELTSLILDEERLRAERHDRKLWKSRVTGLDEFAPTAPTGMGSDPSRPRRERRTGKNGEDEDLEYRLALEASKNEMEEDRRRRAKSEVNVGGDDADLARAIKLSQEEEELRLKQLEQANANSLFDDTPAQQAPQATGWNQGYQQQSAVDWFGNPVDQQQQQPQATGYLNNVYSQPGVMQGQQTGFQNGFGYNPYSQQPQQPQFDQFQQQQQPQYMQPQQTAFNMNNPYGQQASVFDQSQQQAQSSLSPGTNNPWSTSGPTDTSIAPQPTGSNNPFASSFSRPQQQQQSAARAPSLNTLAEQKVTNQFSNSASAFTSSHPAQQQSLQQHPAQDPHAARLNALLATGEGQDTFGNVGNLRIPAQHTAPATFVNSHATTLGRLQPIATGQGTNNPFLSSQMTGMPTTQQMPMQTGGPGGFGGGGYGANASNPFGAAQRNPQQGGSLIDL